MSPPVLGLDVGGANLKAAHTDRDGRTGSARSTSFPLWRRPGDLARALADLVGGLTPFDLLALTMTGELCDCYESKRQGVCAILDAVLPLTGAPVRVWSNQGSFLSPLQAKADPLRVASANWLALAAFAGRYAPKGPALLLDVGSTTTDVVGLLDGVPVPVGRTDPERLESGELVYRGVRRTPACAVLGPEGAAELFATTLDAYLLLGAVPEDPADLDTADGRPATRAFAHARLARMLCADLKTSTEGQRLDLARLLHGRLVGSVASALERAARRLPGRPETIILAGTGEFLARAALSSVGWPGPVTLISLGERLGPAVSAAACAHAVAVLCSEEGARWA
jgi:probable H4MPT-linked C1 transfer pathway protein